MQRLILANDGAKSFGPTVAVVMRAAMTDLLELVIHEAGHCLIEE